MKNRMLKILLSFMMVSLSAPALPTSHQETMYDNDVIVQKKEVVDDSNAMNNESVDVNEEIEMAIEKNE